MFNPALYAVLVVLLLFGIFCFNRALATPPINWSAQAARLVEAVIQVESGGDDRTIGDYGSAAGCLQIHRIMVLDVNRILGRDEFTFEDRFDRTRSIQMFAIYQLHYSAGKFDAEVWARRWNGGPDGHTKRSTIPYWEKVRAVMEARPR